MKMSYLPVLHLPSVFFPQESLEWLLDAQRLRSYQKTDIHWFLHSPNVVSYQISPSLEGETKLLSWQMSYVQRCTDGPCGPSEDKTQIWATVAKSGEYTETEWCEYIQPGIIPSYITLLDYPHIQNPKKKKTKHEQNPLSLQCLGCILFLNNDTSEPTRTLITCTLHYCIHWVSQPNVNLDTRGGS